MNLHAPLNGILSSSGRRSLWAGGKAALPLVGEVGGRTWKPIMVLVHGHEHAPAHAHTHTHTAVAASLPKKAGVYLDSSAPLMRKRLLAGDNKGLAARCST